MIKYPSAVDRSSFTSEGQRTIKYGLPKDITYCKRCLISNQRPSSTAEFKNTGKQDKSTILMKDGICDACRAADIKSKIDWKSREQQLIDLCDSHRRSDGRYDCVVPGSGGKDSFMQAHLLKYKYNMNPLTVTWAPHMYTEWGYRNHQKWIDSGLDNILFTPNSKIHRLLTRLAVDRLFHPFQPFILGQKNLGPRIAQMYDINLVFYGENEAEYGNPIADNISPLRDEKYYSANSLSEIFLGGTSIEELKKIGVRMNELNPYLPLLKKDHSESIQVHYLGYYVKWHPQGAYYYAVDNGGFEPSPERTMGTYSTYNSIDDKIDDFHYHTTFIKFGYGRATEDASQEVRSGDITKEEASLLIQKYDGEYPSRFDTEIFKYLSVGEEYDKSIRQFFEQPEFNKDYYDRLCDNYRSPHIWNWSDQKKKFELRNPPSLTTIGDESKNWKGNT